MTASLPKVGYYVFFMFSLSAKKYSSFAKSEQLKQWMHIKKVGAGHWQLVKEKTTHSGALNTFINLTTLIHEANIQCGWWIISLNLYTTSRGKISSTDCCYSVCDLQWGDTFCHIEILYWSFNGIIHVLAMGCAFSVMNNTIFPISETHSHAVVIEEHWVFFIAHIYI